MALREGLHVGRKSLIFFTSWLCAAGVVSAAACSGVEDSASPSSGRDASTSGGGDAQASDSGGGGEADGSSAGDAAGADGGADAAPPGDGGADASDAGPSGSPTLVVVNAVTDLGPSSDLSSPAGGAIRLCESWSGGGVLTPRPTHHEVMPGAAVAGVPVGRARSQNLIGSSYQTTELNYYIRNAERLAARGIFQGGPHDTRGCRELITDHYQPPGGYPGGLGPLEENVDYWVLPKWPVGTIRDGRFYAIVFSGCAGDSTLPAAACGGDPGGAPGRGTLRADLGELDRTAPARFQGGLQFVHGSPALAGAAIEARPALIAPATPLSAASVPWPPAAKATPFVKVAGVNGASQFTVNAVGNGGAPVAPQAFADIGTASAVTFQGGRGYAFVATGDPAAPFPGPGGLAAPDYRALHAIAIQTSP